MRAGELGLLFASAYVCPYAVRRIEDRLSARAQIALYLACLGALVSTTLAFLVIAMAPEALGAENIVEVLRACFGALSTIFAHPLAHIPALLAAGLLGFLVIRFGLTLLRLTVAAHRARRRGARFADPEGLRLVPAEWRSRVIVTAHEEPIAYVAGIASAVVLVSATFLESLESDERVAALAHEWAHVRRRDPWLLLVATAAARTLSPLRSARACLRGLRRGVEARADDAAVALVGRTAVASAIAKAAIGPTPRGAVAMGESDTVWRVRRLVAPTQRRGVLASALLLLALLIVVSSQTITVARASTLIAATEQVGHHCRLPGVLSNSG